MKTIVQILSIARTEFRFGFRRSAPAVATAVVCLLVGAGTLVPLLAILPEWAANSILTPEKIERLASYGLSPQEWAFFLREYMGDMFVYSTMLAWLLILLALLFLPMATSAGIPADRKFGVSEVLAGYPISGSTYLA
ncbi:MAG TPA: hypothetical protein VMT91_11920, partial [Anaerolineales bacterium]|nr:hypothetical protein [Anaerolineales bacterium]